MRFEIHEPTLMSRVPDGQEHVYTFLVVDHNNPEKLKKFVNVACMRVSTDIPKVSSKFARLKFLKVDAGVNPGKISQVPNLEELDLTGSRIEALPQTLPRLRVLRAGRTKIKFVPHTLTSLEGLFVPRSRINRVPQTLVNLVELDVSGTKVRRVPSALASLKKLSVRKSHVYYIPDNLDLVDIHGSRVWYVPPGVKQVVR